MTPKQWFLVRILNDRAKVVSGMLDSYEDALSLYKSKQNYDGLQICETVYG